jgi:capsular exopolysaccharide synthesis family protein
LSGLIGGCIVAVLKDQSDPSVGMTKNASELLGVPQLGVIPSVTPQRVLRWQMRKRAASRSGTTPAGERERERIELLSWQQRGSLVAESFRVSVASLLLPSANLSPSSMIVVTSPAPREGKTTVLCNFAIALAEIGRRVLIVDADIRAPRIHDIFSIPNSWGITDLVQEQGAIDQYPLDGLVRTTTIPGVFVLPSGPPTLELASLFHSQRLRDLLGRLRREFDIVLIDTPPMLHFAEARILAKMSEGVLMVLRSGQTDRDTALAAAQRLIEDGAHIIGTILNDWTPNSTERKYYGKYYANHYLQHEKTWKAV